MTLSRTWRWVALAALVGYGFNPRMIPDDVYSRPVLRKLTDRDPEEENVHVK